MAYWTTKELDILKAMHAKRVPSYKELAAGFPRHSITAIVHAAKVLKLRRKQRDWIKIARKYSIERGDRALVRA
jgi:hypothetical protein